MARIAYSDPESDPELAGLVARISAQRAGRLPNLFRMLMYNPAIAGTWFDFMSATRKESCLDGRTRELVILNVAALMGAGYPTNDHVPIALKDGVSQAEIEALIERKDISVFGDRDRAVLAYAGAMTQSVQVPQAVFDAARSHLDERELVELTVLVGAYNMVARFLEALSIDLEKP
jgi:alkylhydroperoxidase family enzyme